MLDLRKSTLMKVATTPRDQLFSSSYGQDDYYGRASQIVEIADWLSSTVESAKWFSTKAPSLSHDMIGIFAQKISESTGIPCKGLIRQIIRYTVHSTFPAVFQFTNDDIFVKVLSAILWIICTSTYEELLILLYGLYDAHGDGNMSKESLTILMTDLLVDDNYLNSTLFNFDLNSFQNESVKVSELVDEILEYSDATSNMYQHSKCTLFKTASFCSDSSDESYDNIITGMNSMDGNSRSRQKVISEFTFVNFFLKRKRGAMWKILSFQKKLQEASFGATSWSTVTAWARNQPNVILKSNGPTLHSIFKRLSRDVLKFLGSRPCLQEKREVNTENWETMSI
mmetsp:Transcript_23025/g.23245  ORF Transcript_23025/g.23245 Transcript_23025/m.23245 type:complete len:340 (+) Transcript_23025:180-1199(+)|eukprot:CAMPEP_0182419278 /NCGR_PEP_ID=MMETSP1167-20130531/3728_1 /TAXON_ID=2988 /ORGANISM="Mallomonas Sp, Strain CCMP3275" /LENGTH=339 /DNA_ID=CAMNT_0024594077 /DNA_START=110 /DNA_END=1129 /DNA_ORIENTATION=+